VIAAAPSGPVEGGAEQDEVGPGFRPGGGRTVPAGEEQDRAEADQTGEKGGGEDRIAHRPEQGRRRAQGSEDDRQDQPGGGAGGRRFGEGGHQAPL
jgi:hypothetical protein